MAARSAGVAATSRLAALRHDMITGGFHRKSPRRQNKA
jgi:hypothetical protein